MAMHISPSDMIGDQKFEN